MLSENWGRFTARGGVEVEQRLTRLVREVAEQIAAVAPPDSYKAVLLIGGYGRGEGGVERRDGQELPHNNLDFLMLAQNQNAEQRAKLKQAVDARLRPIAEREGLGLDFGIVPVDTLRHSPCLVMWYDMRFGHKTILGDASFVPSLTQFDVQYIEPADVRNLLVNRGTLFVINQMLLERAELDEQARRTIVKHAVKGIIGYGDALLFSLGQYHWSYQEKQRRMRASKHVPEAFRSLYDQALEFRFSPDYARYPGEDLRAWSASLPSQLAPVHLRFEAFRLRDPKLRWQGYHERALSFALWESPSSWRAWARKLRNLLRTPAAPPASWACRLGFRVSGMRGVLPILFPMVLYDLDDAEYRAFTRRALAAPDASQANLRRAYLRAWGEYGDINFASVLDKLGISLAFKEGAESQ